MSGFAAAVEFLTLVRLRGTVADLPAVARSQAWFPVVGLLVGLMLAGIHWLATRALPDASAAVVVVLALAILTGALHLDGLADATDGLFGGHTPERRLAIMRDVHAGTYAILAVGGVVAMKWAGIIALPSDVTAWALVLTPCLARSAMLVVIAAFPYARQEGIGAAFHDAAWPARTLAGGGIALASGFVLLGPGGVIVVAAIVAIALAIGAGATRLAGGMTGDVYGATVEISEACALLLIASLANRGWIDGWIGA